MHYQVHLPPLDAALVCVRLQPLWADPDNTVPRSLCVEYVCLLLITADFLASTDQQPHS